MKLAFLLLACTIPAFAQPNTCGGLTSVTDSTTPVYPPIAGAARIPGTVILMAVFRLDGEIEHAYVPSGPYLLRDAAVKYFQEWQANPYTRPRTYPIVLTYTFDMRSDALATRIDTQHVTINSQPLI